jgi:hypothetical protein
MRVLRVQFHEVRETFRCTLEGNKAVSFARHRGTCVRFAVFDDVSRAFTQTNKRLPPHVGREVWDNADALGVRKDTATVLPLTYQARQSASLASGRKSSRRSIYGCHFEPESYGVLATSLCLSLGRSFR